MITTKIILPSHMGLSCWEVGDYCTRSRQFIMFVRGRSYLISFETSFVLKRRDAHALRNKQGER